MSVISQEFGHLGRANQADLPVPSHNAVHAPWRKTIQQQPQPAAIAGNHLVPAAFDCPHDFSSNFIGGHPPWVAPGQLAFVFEQCIEVLTFRWARRDEEYLDAQPRQLRPHGFAETVQREFAG